jgi:hypothetical protein
VSCQKRAALPQNQDFLKRKEKKLVQNNLIFNLKKGTRTRIKKVATTAVQLQRRDLLGGAVSLKFLTHVERVEFSRFLKNELVYPLRNFPSEFKELTIYGFSFSRFRRIFRSLKTLYKRYNKIIIKTRYTKLAVSGVKASERNAE